MEKESQPIGEIIQSPASLSAAKAVSLEFKNVTKNYPGSTTPAVSDLSLIVPAGEICVLVGPSGCGKTTAMRLVNRMIELTSGDILIDGAHIFEHKPSELRRHIGYVIQQVGLFPHLKVAKNIAIVPSLLGWDKQRIAERTSELLELVGLPIEFGDRFPSQLSGGQRQRVGVARALATDPPLMLMDEPFGAIDPISRDRLQNEFLRLQTEINKTIVFVTHDIDEAIKIGDHIAIMREGGQLVQYDTPSEILANPADDFVARFVGADRGLKRLALITLTDLDLTKVPVVHDGDIIAPTRWEKDQDMVLLVDEAGCPVGTLSKDQLIEDHKVYKERVSKLDNVIVSTATLREALSIIMTNSLNPLLVVYPNGCFAGYVSIELINQSLNKTVVVDSDSGLVI